jgi:hypothetical protein
MTSSIQRRTVLALTAMAATTLGAVVIALPANAATCHYIDQDGNTIYYDCGPDDPNYGTATGKPSGSPSPSATNANSPAPNATPSDSPTPTSSPGSTRPATNLVPTTSIRPSLVRYGQTAYVTIHGTPGATVDLATRRYPDGFFTTLRRGLVLDSAGNVQVSTAPGVNQRFQARDRTVAMPSSVHGSDGLVTVQRTVTLRVRRAGTRTYSFAGSISPNNPGATVDLYRNGTLIRSRIPVNSSRAYSYTATLKAGTYSFQVRSPATGYNALSFSPKAAIKIH